MVICYLTNIFGFCPVCQFRTSQAQSTRIHLQHGAGHPATSGLRDVRTPWDSVSLVGLSLSTKIVETATTAFLWYSSTEFLQVYLYGKPAVVICPKLFCSGSLQKKEVEF